MNAWYKRRALFIIIVCSFLGQQLAGIALEEQSESGLDRSSMSDRQLDKLTMTQRIARTTFQCKAVDPAYSEIYSFEIRNYRISICQLGDDFYYLRQSKDNENEVLIPAQPVYQSNIFQASDGNATYFAGKDGDRHYSSVMHNTNEIVFEPELEPPSSAFSQNLAEANSNLPQDGVNVRQPDSVSVEPDNLENGSQPELKRVCISESAFHPDLDGWQKLIGKSPDTASKYATNNGHEFSYDERIPNLASIATKEGTIVNLNIAAMSETIEEVCIQSLVENRVTEAN